VKRPPPERLGRYEVQERIGQGGMAEIFHARLQGAAGVSKRVVIKRVLPGLAADPDFVSKFVTEAKVSMTMSHPNVVQVFEFGEQDGA
jgi:serine/threonine protein kinase